MKFDVTVCWNASTVISVDAGSADEACELAYDDVPGGLCHQCSSKVELGDIDGYIVYHDDELVQDDTYSSTLKDKLDTLASSIRALVEEVEAQGIGSSHDIVNRLRLLLE